MWPPEQVWALISVAKELGGLEYALAYIGAFTGVRRNEALGLRFNDIEWFGNEVNVRHAISKRRGTDGAHKWEWHLGPPKSRKSLRRIAATESVMKMLADLKAGKLDGAFIFPGDCNGFIDPDKFDAEVWKPIAEKAGMAGTRFHDLRHFFASQLIAQRRNRRLRSRPDGPFQHQGHLRHLRASIPGPRQGSQRPPREVDGRRTGPPESGGQR